MKKSYKIGIIAIIIGILIVIAIPLLILLLFSSNHGLVILLMPNIDETTLQLLSHVGNPNIFLNKHKIGYIKDDYRNLYKFGLSKTDIMTHDVNYLKNALEKNKHVVFITQDHYKSDMVRYFLTESGNIEHLPEILPSVFIATGNELLKKDPIAQNQTETLFDKHTYYLPKVLDIKDYSFASIIMNHDFPYFNDIPDIISLYQQLWAHFTKGKLNIINNRGITIIDMANPRKALDNGDIVSYLKEMAVVLKAFENIKKLDDKHILFLPVATQKEIEVAKHLDLEHLLNISTSFETIINDKDNIEYFEKCQVLEKYFRTDLPMCNNAMEWTFENLHDLVYDRFGVRLKNTEDNIVTMSFYGTSKRLKSLAPFIETSYKALGQRVSDIFQFTTERHIEKTRTRFNHQFKNQLSSQCNFGKNDITGSIDFGVEEFVNMRCYNSTDKIDNINLFKYSDLSKKQINSIGCDTLELLDDQNNILDSVNVQAVTLHHENEYKFGQIVSPVVISTCSKYDTLTDLPFSVHVYKDGEFVDDLYEINSFESQNILIKLVETAKSCNIIQQVNLKTTPVHTFELLKNVYPLDLITHNQLYIQNNFLIEPSSYSDEHGYSIDIPLNYIFMGNTIDDDDLLDSFERRYGQMTIRTSPVGAGTTASLYGGFYNYQKGHYQIDHLDFCVDFYIVDSCPFDYQVKIGDSLESISEKFKTDKNDILDANPGLSNIIPEQIIQIPC